MNWFDFYFLILGISKVGFTILPFTAIPQFFVHQKDLLNSDMPGVSTGIDGHRSWQIFVTNEHLHLLNYDKEPHITNVTYDWYQCKHEYIYKVQNILCGIEHTKLCWFHAS